MTLPKLTTNQKIGIAAGVVITLVVFRPKTEKSASPYDPITNPNGAFGFNAAHVANGLLNAMKSMGTDEQAIFEILTPVNQVQFGKVVQAFGKRQYNKLFGNQVNYIPFYTLPFVDLKGWLQIELSKENYATLRTKYPNYL